MHLTGHKDSRTKQILRKKWRPAGTGFEGSNFRVFSVLPGHMACMVLLVCRMFKMVGKSDHQTITGHVLLPYFPLASQCMIPKHVRAECVKCTTVVLEAHLARTTRKSNARLNIQFLYGWWVACKLVARATCSISTTHFQTPQKHYVLYRRAVVNKSAEPVSAKTRMAGCKASLSNTNQFKNYKADYNGISITNIPLSKTL